MDRSRLSGCGCRLRRTPNPIVADIDLALAVDSEAMRRDKNQVFPVGRRSDLRISPSPAQDRIEHRP